MAHDNIAGRDDEWRIDDETWGDDRYPLRKHNRVRRGRPSVRERRHGGRGDAAGDAARTRPVARRRRPDRPQAFRCRHCRALVGPVPSGGRHRNHCPFCLHSRHVDDHRPGDRASTCGGTMAPVGRFTRRGGEYALVHRCYECGVERHNRIAADDDFALVLRLPDLTRHTPLPEWAAGATRQTTA